MELKTLDEKKEYLKQLASDINYTSLRITLAPDKENITEEMVIDDMICLFEAKRDGKMKEIDIAEYFKD
jgi:hypothetical protein